MQSKIFVLRKLHLVQAVFYVDVHLLLDFVHFSMRYRYRPEDRTAIFVSIAVKRNNNFRPLERRSSSTNDKRYADGIFAIEAN